MTPSLRRWIAVLSGAVLGIAAGVIARDLGPLPGDGLSPAYVFGGLALGGLVSALVADHQDPAVGSRQELNGASAAETRGLDLLET